MPDATIIGGGPAGSVAAVMLARSGWDVTLVEQHRFPRDKVCGECLSAVGIDVLDDLELLDRVGAAGPIELTRTLVHAPDGTSVELPLPRSMWGLSRNTLDATLLAAAVESGARVLQPARCERVSLNGSVEVNVRDLKTNAVAAIHPRWLIVADGKSALLSTNRPAPTTDLGLRGHFAGASAPRDAIQLFGVRGHYGGLAPIEDGQFNVAFSVPARRVAAARGDLDALFAQIRQENPALARQLAPARRTGDWLASPLPRHGLRRNWPTGVIPVGNAAAAIEPIGGEGMGLAMRSAQLAAMALTSGSFDRAALDRAYRDLWRTRPFACRAAALAISRIASVPLHLLQTAPHLGDTTLRLMGKAPVQR